MDHLELGYELIDVGNVTLTDTAVFRQNPMMSVPVFEDAGVWLIESDHITQHIARRFDPDNRFRSLNDDPTHLNFRAILNGAMDNEVKLVLSRRMGLEPVGLAYFDKARAALDNALGWRETNRSHFNMNDPGDLEFHLV